LPPLINNANSPTESFLGLTYSDEFNCTCFCCGPRVVRPAISTLDDEDASGLRNQFSTPEIKA
jgi:hypothetical protein